MNKNISTRTGILLLPVLWFAASAIAQTPPATNAATPTVPARTIRRVLTPEDAKALIEQRRAAKTNDAASATGGTNIAHATEPEDFASAFVLVWRIFVKSLSV